MKYSERKLLDTSDSGDLTLFQLSTQTCGTNFKFVTVKIIILILFGFFGRVWIWKHAMCMQMASIKKVKYM